MDDWLGSWTHSERVNAELRGPIGSHIRRADSRIIESPDWYQIITPSLPVESLNEIVLSRVAAQVCEPTIDGALRTARELGVPLKWFVGGLTAPSDMAARLSARGFPSWYGRGMSLRCPQTPRAPTLCVRPVDMTNIASYCQASSVGWQLDYDKILVDHTRYLAQPTRDHDFFVVEIAGAPAGAAAIYYCSAERAGQRQPVAYLMSAVVVPGHRGRGVYRALVDARLQVIRSRGIELVITQAREATSAPILEKLGFRSDCRFQLFSCDT